MLLVKTKSSVEQEAADLADEGGAVIDYAPPGAMQRLDVLLLNRLLQNEGNVRLTGCHTDRLGVIAVILLPAHERLHILQADDQRWLWKSVQLRKLEFWPVTGMITGNRRSTMAR